MDPETDDPSAAYGRSIKVVDRLNKAVTSAHAAGQALAEVKCLMATDENSDTRDVDALIGALHVIDNQINAEWRWWVDVADERSRRF